MSTPRGSFAATLLTAFPPLFLVFAAGYYSVGYQYSWRPGHSTALADYEAVSKELIEENQINGMDMARVREFEKREERRIAHPEQIEGEAFSTAQWIASALAGSAFIPFVLVVKWITRIRRKDIPSETLEPVYVLVVLAPVVSFFALRAIFHFSGLDLAMSHALTTTLSLLIAFGAVIVVHSFIAVHDESLTEAETQRQRAHEQRVLQQQQTDRAAEQQKANAAQQHLLQQSAATRRKEARFQCEMHFSLYQTDIAQRFNHAMFDSYMQKYMGDMDDAETVERRGQELRTIIDKHYEQVGGKAMPTTIEELTAWFLEQKTRIERAPMEARQKQTLLALLTHRYSDLSQQMLEEMKP